MLKPSSHLWNHLELRSQSVSIYSHYVILRLQLLRLANRCCIHWSTFPCGHDPCMSLSNNTLRFSMIHSYVCKATSEKILRATLLLSSLRRFQHNTPTFSLQLIFWGYEEWLPDYNSPMMNTSCLLRTMDSEEVDQHQLKSLSPVASLVIHFSCGWVA